MMKAMKKIWTINEIDPVYDVIILDYFFSPAGWVNVRWTEKFFSEKILKKAGTLWLPNVNYVTEMIHKNEQILSQHYSWDVIENPLDNPLYEATNLVTNELL